MKNVDMTKFMRLLLLLLVIISSGGVYFQFFSLEVQLLTVIITCFLYVKNRIVFNKPIILGIFLVLITNYVLNINGDLKITSYISLYLNVIITYILFGNYKQDKTVFAREIEFVLRIVILHALLNFIIINLIGEIATTWIKNFGPASQYETETISYLFFNSHKIKNNLLYRNCGMFWEPGILQIYVNIYLFLEYFLIKRTRKFMVATAILVLFTTQSTTGFIVFLLQTTVYLSKKITLPKFAIVTTFMITIFPIITNNFDDKFAGENSISYQARLFDFMSGVYIITDSPIFGSGYNPSRTIFGMLSHNALLKASNVAELNFVTDRGNTNSVMNNFIAWGIPIGIIVLYLLYKQTILPVHKKLVFLMFIIFCASEPLLFTPIFILFIISGFYKKIQNTDNFNGSYE